MVDAAQREIARTPLGSAAMGAWTAWDALTPRQRNVSEHLARLWHPPLPHTAIATHHYPTTTVHDAALPHHFHPPTTPIPLHQSQARRRHNTPSHTLRYRGKWSVGVVGGGGGWKWRARWVDVVGGDVDEGWRVRGLPAFVRSPRGVADAVALSGSGLVGSHIRGSVLCSALRGAREVSRWSASRGSASINFVWLEHEDA